MIHDNRLFLAGLSTETSGVYFSDPYLPDTFDVGTNYELFHPDDGSLVTGLVDQFGVLRVFKTNTISSYYTKGTPSTDWYPSSPLSHIGCPAPYSIANSPIGIFYMGRDGIYLFDGQYSRLVSDVVREDMRDINQSDIN